MSVKSEQWTAREAHAVNEERERIAMWLRKEIRGMEEMVDEFRQMGRSHQVTRLNEIIGAVRRIASALERGDYLTVNLQDFAKALTSPGVRSE